MVGKSGSGSACSATETSGANPAAANAAVASSVPTPCSAVCTARADRDAIGIALRNVIENALLYGANNTPVEVWVDAAHSIHVANEGAVVETSKLAKLTQRFQRGGDGADGSGLGLAIADTIMQQSGGGLSLHSPAIGRDGGFEAVLHLG